METVYFAKWILLDSGELLLNGAISVNGSVISGIGPRSKVRRHSESRIVNLGDVLLLPGLFNMHIHLEDGILRGTSKRADETFASWSAKKNSRLRTTPHDQIIPTMRLTIKELLAQGITSIADYSRYGYSTEILKEESIRSWIFHEMHTDDQNQEDSLVSSCKTRATEAGEKINAGIGPHAIFSLSPNYQKELISFSKSHNLLWSSHIAESAEELQAFSEKKGDLFFYTTRKRPWPFDSSPMGPMNYAIQNELIPQNGICVHCNYVNGQELTTLADNNISIVLCYSYTLEMGHKLFPLEVALKRNCNICLGTEGITPHGFLSIFDELFALKQAYPHITARELLLMVTRNPARALQVEHCLGSLTEGKLADIIAVRFAHSEENDLLEELLVEEPEIALVVINGEEIIFNC